MYSIYNQHPADDVFNTNLGIYDASKDSILAFIHPDLPCIGLTHFSGNLVAASDKEITVAHPCGYTLEVYDLTLHKTATITHHPTTGWRALPQDTIPMETRPDRIHPKALIDRLFLLNDTISRIQNIYYLDSSELLLIASAVEAGKSYNRIDVWNTRNTSKPVIESPQVKTDLSGEEIISLRDFPMLFNSPLQIDLANDRMLVVYDLDFHPRDKQTVIDYNKAKDIYYEKADPYFSIGIFEVVLP